MEIDNFLLGIIGQSNAAINVSDGDYTVDGILFCGKCHTAKQACITIPGGTQWKPMAMCKCEKEKYDKAEAARRENERKAEIKKFASLGFKKKDFENCVFENDNGKNSLIKVAKNFVDRFDEFRNKGKGLLFYGTTGVGKSYAAYCIANALAAKGCSVLVTNFLKITSECGSIFGDRDRKINGMTMFDLVVIDDLGVERSSEFVQEIEYQVVDTLCNAKIPCIVTTNLSAAQLRNPQTMNDARIYSRLKEMTYPVAAVGDDQRVETAKSEYSDFVKEFLK